MSRPVSGLSVRVMEINGRPGMVAIAEGHPLLAVVLEVHAGRISDIRIVANPDKLTFLAAQFPNL